MRWYAVLFWLWVLGSLAILVWRRTSGRGSVTGPAEERPDPLSRRWGPPPPEDGAGVAPAVSGEIDEEPVTTRPRPVPPESRDPRPPEPAAWEPAPGRPTLADLLAGITLPHGLVPLTQFDGQRDPATHIVVATDSASPDDVRRALEDELVRLGYEVERTGPHAALAEGDRGRVGIAIHPDPARVEESGTPRFPTALPGTVVVELSVE